MTGNNNKTGFLIDKTTGVSVGLLIALFSTFAFVIAWANKIDSRISQNEKSIQSCEQRITAQENKIVPDRWSGTMMRFYGVELKEQNPDINLEIPNVKKIQMENPVNEASWQ